MILENNQYPPSFYEPIIKRTLNKIIDSNSEQQDFEREDQKKAKLVFVQYRGRMTERFEHSLKRCMAPCKVVYTLCKVKSVLLSLKTPVEKALKSRVVYKITCPQCNSCYVGQTSWHLLNCIKEHCRKVTPVGSHFTSCNHTLEMDDVCILAGCVLSVVGLMTLEVLWINCIKPSLNTKEEYRSRTLLIKLFLL